MPASPRALVYRPGSLGDTLVSLPAVGEIRRRYPDHRLTLLTEGHLAGSGRVSPWTIFKDTGWFEEVNYYAVRPSSVAERWHNVSLAARLRAAGYDRIFSLAPPRTDRQLRVDRLILRWVVGARQYHAARHASWPPGTATEGEHEGLRLLRIVDPAAQPADLQSVRLQVPDAERMASRSMLDSLGIDGGQLLVGLGPGSGRASTAWPVERFAAVGKALLQEFRNVVLLAIGGSNEQVLCSELCAAWGPRSHNLAGRLSVLQSASVLSQCATFIGNDSGPTHLAAMVGIPCVAIFSARNPPGQWEPIGPHHVVIEERPACAGCMLDECVREANKCLTRIETGRVVREAISLIASRGRSCLAH